MNNIINFQYDSNDIRVITDEHGNPWWIAKEICDVLGLSNPTEAIRALDEDEKSTLRISEGAHLGGPERNIVNEPGLYTLIIRSNKPEAKKFKRWITHEVLPSIRKTGRYEIPREDPETFVIRKHAGLKTNQRIRLLEMAYRMNDMDRGGRQKLFHDFDTLCGAFDKKSEADGSGGGELDDFLEFECEFDTSAATAKDDLYEAYVKFAEEEGLARMCRGNFFKCLYKYPDLKCTRPTLNGKRAFVIRGLRLDNRQSCSREVSC